MMDCSLRQLQMKELEILEEFNRVCKENHLSYVLAYGTLLGAIRHKGFIPWDDDIDVFMMYEDYQKLQEACNNSLGDKFIYQSRKVNPENFCFWDRIGIRNTTSIDISLKNIKADWNICIDIFPIFSVGSDEATQKQKLAVFRKLQILSLKYYNRELARKEKGIGKIKKLITGYIPNSLNKKLSHKYLEKLEGQSSDRDIFCFSYDSLNVCGYFKKEWFEKTIDVEFEGKKYPAPFGYRAFLSNQYGDFMKIPDEDNRENHSDNDNVRVFLNTPYTKYLKD